MSDSAPDLHMLNVVVGDMPASLDFYRRLGIVVPDGEVTTGVHVQLRMPVRAENLVPIMRPGDIR